MNTPPLVGRTTPGATLGSCWGNYCTSRVWWPPNDIAGATFTVRCSSDYLPHVGIATVLSPRQPT